MYVAGIEKTDYARQVDEYALSGILENRLSLLKNSGETRSIGKPRQATVDVC